MGEERKLLPLFTDLLSKCCSSIQQCAKSNKFFYRSVASFYWIRFLTIFIETKVSIKKQNMLWFTQNNTSLLLSCPLVDMVLGMFCKIFAVFGKQLSCPFHPCACYSSVKQHYFGDIEIIFAWKQFFFLGIKNFCQQQIMLITNLKKGYNSTF